MNGHHTSTRSRVPGRGWAYAGAVLGGAVSVAANVAHSYVPPKAVLEQWPADAAAKWAPEPGAVIGAVFWPVALFVAIEILARIPWPDGKRWAALRYLGLLPVALVAAVVSYRHLAGLLRFYGEDSLTAAIGPLAVDGLMVMATGALIATGARRRTGQPDVEHEATPAATASDPEPAATAAPTADRTPAPATARTRAPRRTTRTGGKAGRSGTATAIARLIERHPDLSQTEIAKRLRISDRTVRRHLAGHTDPSTTQTTDPTVPAGADRVPVDRIAA